MIAAQIAARAIEAIFNKNGVLSTKVTACELNKAAPESALTRKPIHPSLTRPVSEPCRAGKRVDEKADPPELDETGQRAMLDTVEHAE